MTGPWVIGAEVARVTRTMTAERMHWYCDALETALAGHVVVAGVNIHTDDEFARANGLPSKVADGMISTNWLASLLLQVFGEDYLRTGTLRTNYVRPVLEDAVLTGVIEVTAIEGLADGTEALTLAVWCETADGIRCTVGDATLRVQTAPVGPG